MRLRLVKFQKEWEQFDNHNKKMGQILQEQTYGTYRMTEESIIMNTKSKERENNKWINKQTNKNEADENRFQEQKGKGINQERSQF